MDVFISILISLILFIHTVHTSTPTDFTPRITKSPGKSNKVLIGNKIKLEWKFEFQHDKELSTVSLLRYNPISKAKHAIAFMLATSKTVQYSPLATHRYVCKVNLDSNGVGSAVIQIDNSQFNHSANYGIRLESQKQHLPIENFVSVKVVDMVANKTNVSETVRSWIGHKTLLNCGVIHRTKTEPTFEWIRKSKNDITRDIFLSSNTSIITIEPANITDFGQYICKARTRMVTVKQNFLVVKIDYSGPPGDVKYKFYKENGVLTIFWKQADKQDLHRARKYMVQILEPQETQWKTIFKTEKLFVSFKDVKGTIKLRVCSTNEIGYVDSSCSKPMEFLARDRVKSTSGKRGNSSHITAWWLLIYIMTSISLKSSLL